MQWLPLERNQFLPTIRLEPVTYNAIPTNGELSTRMSQPSFMSYVLVLSHALTMLALTILTKASLTRLASSVSFRNSFASSASLATRRSTPSTKSRCSRLAPAAPSKKAVAAQGFELIATHPRHMPRRKEGSSTSPIDCRRWSLERVVGCSGSVFMSSAYNVVIMNLRTF